MRKISLFVLCILSLVGCTSDINSDIPVSSNDLIDQNVVYKSETVKVDIEESEMPRNNFSKPTKIEEEKTVATVETKNEIQVIIPPKAVDDETIDFTTASYYTRNPEEVEFEMAVAQAQARRGITPKQNAKPVVVPVKEETKPQIKKKLEIKKITPERNITFLSSIIYHSNTKADISDKDIKALKNVAKLAIEKNAIVRVVGNASSRSKDMKEVQNKLENFNLSLLRAQKVRDVLVKYGVPLDKIFINAVADTEKVVEENMPINEAINRRTEIYLNY